MAENKDATDENFEDPINITPDYSSKKLISESELGKTINTPLQIEDMETHAHHLHKAPWHGWKHYFFEFVMLFLAVFCGFLAENLREAQVEHRREKLYMNSMIQDLKSDTSLFQINIKEWYTKINQVDTLFQLLTGNDINKNLRQCYTLEYIVVRNFQRPHYNSRTFDEMRNSGNLRLINNTAIADSITEFYNKMKWIDDIRDVFNNVHEDLIKYQYLAYDTKIFHKMVGRKSLDDLTVEDSPPLMDYNTKDFNQYLAYLQHYYILNALIKNYIENDYLPATIRLLTLLQSYYGDK
jgi:hypothetical protein